MKYSELNIKIGKNISKLRKKNCLTQKELSEKLPVTRGHLSCLEIGKSEISIPHLILICKVLKCRINEIIPENFI